MIRRLSFGGRAWVALGTIGAAALSFAFQAYLSFVLSDSQFGAVSASIVTAVALAVLIAYGAQNVMLDWSKRRHNPLRPMLTVYLRVWVGTLVVAAFIAAALALLSPEVLPEYFFIASMTLLLGLISILGAERQSRDDFRSVSLTLLAPEVIKCLAVVLVFATGARTLTSVYGIMGAAFTVVCVTAIFLPALWRRPTGGPTLSHVLRSGFPYALSGVMFMFYYRATLVVFSLFHMLDAGGSLAIIYLFMTAVLLLPTTYSQRYLLGKWHSIPQNKPNRFRRELRRQLRSILLFTLPIAILWFAFAPQILDLLYSDRYQLAHQWASWFAIVFVMRSLSIPLQAAASVGPLRWGKTFVIVGAAATTIGAAALLAQPLGFASAFVSAIAAESVLSIGLLVIISRHLRGRSSNSRA